MHIPLEGRTSLNVSASHEGYVIKDIKTNLTSNLMVTGIYIRKFYDTINRHPLVFISLEEIRFPVY